MKCKVPTRWLYAGLLLALVIVFAPSLKFKTFIYDGQQLVNQHSVLQAPFDLKQIVTTDYWGLPKGKSIGSYRPFAIFALWIEQRLWGGHVWPYICLHLLLMFAICVLLRRLALLVSGSSEVSWLSAYLFAVHPIHTDVVISIAGQADLWMTLLFFGALWLHQKKTAPARGLATLAVVLGLCSKEFFVVFPAVVVSWELVNQPRPFWRDWRGLWERFPFASISLYTACVVGYIGIRMAATGIFVRWPYGFVDNPLVGESFAIRLLNVPVLLWRYAVLFLAPLSLSPDRSYNSAPTVHSIGSFEFLGGFVLCCLSFVCLYLLRRKKALFLLLFAVLAYLPLSNVVIPSTSTMADRWLFLTTAPLCIGVAWAGVTLAQTLPKWRNVLVVGLLVYLGSLSWIAFDYTSHWRSHLTLFAYAARNTPNNMKARFIYGQELERRQHWSQARQQYLAMHHIKKDSDLAAVSLARINFRLDFVAQAEKWLQRAIRLQGKKQSSARMEYYFFLKMMRRFKEAEVLRKESHKLFPKNKTFLPPTPSNVQPRKKP